MNKKQTQIIHREAGFVLFVALLTASFILAVGLGVSALSIRGFQLSNNTTESIKALYAANAGIECALYYDLKEGSDPFGLILDSSDNLTSVQKIGQPLDCASSYESGTTDIIDPNGGPARNTTDNVNSDPTQPVWFWLSFRTTVSYAPAGDGPCVYVTIKKTVIPPASNGQYSTRIDAYGYNLHGRGVSNLLTCQNGIPGRVVSSTPGRVERLLESNY